jgi:hypothetical protein
MVQTAMDWGQANWIPLAGGAFAGAGVMFLFVLIRRKILYGRAFGPIARYDRADKSAV